MKESIIVYGVGNMGQAVASVLLNQGYRVACFIDQGIYQKKDIIINGIPVLAIHPTELDVKQKSLDILVSMAAAPVYLVREYLSGIGCKHIYPAGDYIQSILPNEIIANVWNLSETTYKNLLLVTWEDGLSDTHWRIACEWFLNRSEEIIKKNHIVLNREKFFPEFVKERLEKNSIMIDSAVLNGEFSRKFIEYTGGTVYAFSLHPVTNIVFPIPSCCNIATSELSSHVAKISSVRFGLSLDFCRMERVEYHTIPLDTYCTEKNIAPSFIRIYSMSEVLPIVDGAKNMIEKYHPTLAINIGHYQSDFINIRCFLESCYDFYSFQFRIHSFSGNDCILYAIPKDL